MFIRNKKNKSGVVSVQIIDKSTGRYKVIKTIGSSGDSSEVKKLVIQAEQWIKEKTGVIELDFSNEVKTVHQILGAVEQLTIGGTELLLGKLFDEIGFNAIEDELFRRLVIARLCYPASKLGTTDYLYKYHYLQVDVQSIYRYLDKLYNKQKEQVQNISYSHTLKVLHNNISIVFYDVTTLYFEIDNEDELRKTGFSKEGKHQHPQIVLGLLVSIDGYPLAYEIFEGNKFEGHTMLPVINTFKNKYKLEKLVIIADSGLLSSENVAELQAKGYEFILGARIKNEKHEVQKKILELKLINGQSEVIEKDEYLRLVVSFSESRSKKDKSNREKGLKKLEKQIKTGKLTKANINNRGYNKYLKLEGTIEVTIDQEKFKADGKWDGLKGYLTNTNLTKDEIIINYSHLWKIEKAFRVAKTDLKIRPIFHFKPRRIEAHICIAFAAYKLYKELERQLKEKKAEISTEKAIAIAKTIYSITLTTPTTKEKITKTLILNEDQKNLISLFGL
ncbi:MAG: IS1634 family transposase [Ferruginibacter sp.]